MKDMLKKYASTLIIALVMVIFIVCALVIPEDLSQANVMFWAGFGFILFAFVAFGAVTVVSKRDERMLVSSTLLVYSVPVIYLVVTFILNICYMTFGYSADNKVAAFLPNVIILILAVIGMVIVYKSASHVSATDKKIEEKVKVVKLNTLKVNTLIYKVTDPDVKRSLTKLKDAAQYSDPMGVPATAEIEAQFEQCLQVLEDLIASGADKENLLQAIHDADSTLKIRNELLKANKERY